MSATTASPVQKISGGCLCGSVRYDVTFTSWPPESGTCQCTMCRKFTGSVYPQLMLVRTEQVTPPLSSSPAYREFSSSPGRFRGFCGNCGSPLVWRSTEKPHEFDIFLGSIDEKFLIGERVEGTEKETPHGITVERHGGLGKDICTPNQAQLFWENAIPGVTDLLHGGKRYLTWDENGEEPLPDSNTQEIEAQFEINVFSQIRILRAVLPSMRARRSGVVANLGSIGGWRGTPAAGMYCASKAAIAIYTESLRAEMAHFDIDVTCVEPGYLRTNFLTGGHRVVTKNRIPELEQATQGTHAALDAYSLRQPGDPAKGAQVLFEALTKTGRCEGRQLPGRLALGRDAVDAIGNSLASEQDMLDKWKDVIATTDCDDVQVN